MQPSGAVETVQPSIGVLLRRRAAGANADDSSSRLAGHRHRARRGALLDHRLLRPAGRCRVARACSRTRTTGCAKSAARDAARRHDAVADSASTTGTSAGSTSIATRRRSPLPKGTRAVDASTRYDNSAENPRNPQLPPQRVFWGQRSFDEMGDLWFQFVTRNGRDRDAAERADSRQDDGRGHRRLRDDAAARTRAMPSCTTMWRCCICRWAGRPRPCAHFRPPPAEARRRPRRTSTSERRSRSPAGWTMP